MKSISILFLLIMISLLSCENDKNMGEVIIDLTDIEYRPIEYALEFPESFPQFEQPADNRLTLDGVLLGRHLFYDPILSIDSSLSCSSCHLPEMSFTDQLAQSPGVHGQLTPRSSMSLLNVGFFYNGLFWDGRVGSLEEQAVHPVEDVIELNNSWPEVIQRLKRSEYYPELFRKAFGIDNSGLITRDLAVKALAQFERTLVSSGESKYDKVLRGQAVFTDEEQIGFDIYFDRDPELPDGECFHCHSAPLLTNNDYMNNGLVMAEEFEDFQDRGFGDVTGNIIDNGKFRVPTLRNIEFSAPYMHDGRLKTLDEVLEHYNSGGQISKGKDALIVPLGLNQKQLSALKAFLLTLTDEAFMENEAYSNPNG